MPPSLLPASLALKAASGSCDRVPPKTAQSSDGNHKEIQLTPLDSQPHAANQPINTNVSSFPISSPKGFILWHGVTLLLSSSHMIKISMVVGPVAITAHVQFLGSWAIVQVGHISPLLLELEVMYCSFWVLVAYT